MSSKNSNRSPDLDGFEIPSTEFSDAVNKNATPPQAAAAGSQIADVTPNNSNATVNVSGNWKSSPEPDFGSMQVNELTVWLTARSISKGNRTKAEVLRALCQKVHDDPNPYVYKTKSELVKLAATRQISPAGMKNHQLAEAIHRYDIAAKRGVPSISAVKISDSREALPAPANVPSRPSPPQQGGSLENVYCVQRSPIANNGTIAVKSPVKPIANSSEKERILTNTSGDTRSGRGAADGGAVQASHDEIMYRQLLEARQQITDLHRDLQDARQGVKNARVTDICSIHQPITNNLSDQRLVDVEVTVPGGESYGHVQQHHIIVPFPPNASNFAHASAVLSTIPPDTQTMQDAVQQFVFDGHSWNREVRLETKMMEVHASDGVVQYIRMRRRGYWMINSQTGDTIRSQKPGSWHQTVQERGTQIRNLPVGCHVVVCIEHALAYWQADPFDDYCRFEVRRRYKVAQTADGILVARLGDYEPWSEIMSTYGENCVTHAPDGDMNTDNNPLGDELTTPDHPHSSPQSQSHTGYVEQTPDHTATGENPSPTLPESRPELTRGDPGHTPNRAAFTDLSTIFNTSDILGPQTIPAASIWTSDNLRGASTPPRDIRSSPPGQLGQIARGRTTRSLPPNTTAMLSPQRQISALGSSARQNALGVAPTAKSLTRVTRLSTNDSSPMSVQLQQNVSGNKYGAPKRSRSRSRSGSASSSSSDSPMSPLKQKQRQRQRVKFQNPVHDSQSPSTSASQ